jgi:DNA-binding transcriptional LysR family regulator
VEDAVRVELRALRWAIIAAQHKSLRRAAETQNIRLSTLSQALRDLEHRLGAILSERTNGGTRATVAGEAFLDAARRILKEAEAIAARVKMRSKSSGSLLQIFPLGTVLRGAPRGAEPVSRSAALRERAREVHP